MKTASQVCMTLKGFTLQEADLTRRSLEILGKLIEEQKKEALCR